MTAQLTNKPVAYRFYQGQPVIYIQSNQPGGTQGIAADVVRVVEGKAQIELERMGRLTKMVVNAAELLPACVDCKMWPQTENGPFCEGCVELAQALSLAPTSDRCDSWEQGDLPEQVEKMLAQVDEMTGMRYSGIDTRPEGCPVCGSYQRAIYTGIDDQEQEALCEECGLDEVWFGPAGGLRYAANHMLYQLEKLVERLSQGKPISNAELEKIKVVVEQNRKLLAQEGAA